MQSKVDGLGPKLDVGDLFSLRSNFSIFGRMLDSGGDLSKFLNFIRNLANGLIQDATKNGDF
jgi:hypothetical protein